MRESYTLSGKLGARRGRSRPGGPLEGLRDSSGLFAVGRHPEAAHRAALGMHALQHRGGQSLGLAVSDGEFMRCFRGFGDAPTALVGPVLQRLPGTYAIGQVHGGGDHADEGLQGGDQLVFTRYRGGQLTVAVSGVFTNGSAIRRQLKEDGVLLQSSAQAELLANLIARSGQRTEVNRLVDALWQVEGGFCALVGTADKLVAVRGPRGFRSLWMGEGHNGAIWFATEAAAIRFAGGRPTRELAPGEMAVVDTHGVHCISPFHAQPTTACIQEYVSICGDGGEVFGHDVWRIRVGLGERLAREAPAQRASVVVGAPGAGEALAEGFARAARVPVAAALKRAVQGSQQLVEPPSGMSGFHSRLRWQVVRGVVSDRSVCLVVPALIPKDGTKEVVDLLRQSGATEVHLRVASPLVRHACVYGVPTPTGDELDVLGQGLVALARSLGVDTLDALELDSLHAVVGRKVDGSTLYCDACISGVQPVTPEREDDDQLPLF